MPLIVFEGIDGSGKSTQARALELRLKERGIDAVLTTQPSTGPLFLADEEILQKCIRRWLSEGKWVVSDRYWLSMLAYQTTSAEKEGANREAVMKLITQLHEHMVEPAVTFICETSVDVAMSRTRKDGYAKREFLERVKQVYDEVRGNVWRIDTEHQAPDEAAVQVDRILTEQGF